MIVGSQFQFQLASVDYLVLLELAGLARTPLRPFCGAWQVNVTSYMERRVHKDYIQLEIVVEKEGQKGILLGKVRFILLLS